MVQIHVIGVQKERRKENTKVRGVRGMELAFNGDDASVGGGEKTLDTAGMVDNRTELNT